MRSRSSLSRHWPRSLSPGSSASPRPCVLPMVSITSGVLGVNRAASRGRPAHRLCYAAGIIITFTAWECSSA